MTTLWTVSASKSSARRLRPSSEVRSDLIVLNIPDVHAVEILAIPTSVRQHLALMQTTPTYVQVERQGSSRSHPLSTTTLSVCPRR